ncbi:MAG: hypothetical protein NVS3B10_15170 [Polyangiales bacterium]
MAERVATIPTLDRPAVAVTPPNLVARPITKHDFDKIVQVVDHWWDGPIAALAHPMFFYEFGKFARVVEDIANDGRLVGFLLGFVMPADGSNHATGYVHLVGIDPSYRRKGVARALYHEFAAICASVGCLRLKAITTVGNEGSIRFHQALGWTATEDPDYAGPGRRRIVLSKTVA